MDIWGPVTPPTTYGQHFNTFLAAKRGLYIALQHAELAVDMVVEDDIGPTLNSYKLIVLADTHVTNKAAAGLAAWVAAGVGALGLVFVVVCVCCASAGGSSAKGARVPLEDETAFGWEEQGEEEGEEEGEAPARVELD